MKRIISSEWPFLVLLALLSIFFIRSINTVPFHPDESTQIYMSSDFEALFTRPSALFFDSQEVGEPRQRYRLIDAPLARNLIGLGRSLVALPVLSSDWDWAKSWDANRQAGALPSRNALTIARLSITLLLPLSLICLYLTAKSIQGRLSGYLVVVLVAASALVLLHGRRAMAEGAIILGTTFFIWSLLKAHRRPWLTGLAMALAFNAKHSTLALLPVGLLAVAWLQSEDRAAFQGTIAFSNRSGERKSQQGVPQSPSVPNNSSRRRPTLCLSLLRFRTARFRHQTPKILTIIKNIAYFMGVFLLVTLLLNPVFWIQPVEALKTAVLERQDLLNRQLADTQRLAPEKALDSPTDRALVILANLYITPPSFYEVGNYAAETQASEQNYLAIPAHNLLRGFLGGGMLLFLTLLGMAVTLLQLTRPEAPHRRTLALLLLATLFQFAGLVLAVPLPWQRYVIPLIPFTTLWSALGLSFILSTIPRPAFIQEAQRKLPSKPPPT